MGARKFSAVEKAAVVLLALGEELAAKIVAEMAPGEARRIAQALATLGRVEQSVVDEVLAEFHDKLTDPRKFVVGNSAAAKRMLDMALGADAGPAGQYIDLATPALTDTLAEIDTKVLAVFLKTEQPQTTALVLAHLDARRAGEVLKLLPASLHTDLVLRMARLTEVDPEVLHDLEESIRNEARRAASVGRRAGGPLGGVDRVAALLNSVDKERGDALLDSIEERAPELADAVRQRMFTFADLVKIDDRGIQTLLKEVPTELFKLALKKAPEPVLDLILRNLSQRAAAMLKDDLASGPKAKLSDVEAAQRQIAGLAQKLDADGKLIIRKGEETYV